jgi:hypothetical protein
MGWSSVDTNMLQVVFPLWGRYIVSQPTGINGPVQMIREKIERYDAVKDWINICQVMHTTVCMIKNPSTVRYAPIHSPSAVLANKSIYWPTNQIWSIQQDVHQRCNF